MSEIYETMSEIKNEVYEPQEQPEQPEQKDTVIVFCVIGNQFSEKFLRNWTELFGYCIKNNIQPVLSNFNGDNNYIYKNGCLLAKINKEDNVPFQGNLDYDYIVWIHENMNFNVDTFKALYEQDKQVISTISTNNFSLNKLNFIQNIDFNNPSQGEFIDKNDVKQLSENGTTIKVEFFNFGFVMMKRGVLEKIGYPWFNAHKQSNDLKGDVFFCQRCKECNIDLYVDLKTYTPTERKLTV